MSNSFSARIERMKSRRKGTFDQLNVARESISNQRIDGLENYALLEGFLDLNESWETRGKQDSATRYVIGAMQPVDNRYTEISFETAKRIENQLVKKLDLNLEFRVQGSVPLDIHIKSFRCLFMIATVLAATPLRTKMMGISSLNSGMPLGMP